MSTEQKSAMPPFAILPILVVFAASIFLLNDKTNAPFLYHRPDSYRTGLPTSGEITYGTVRHFDLSNEVRAQEIWEFSEAEKAKKDIDEDVPCGHIDRWKYPDDSMHPYIAVVYYNFSRHWPFATLSEAESFVNAWCKP